VILASAWGPPPRPFPYTDSRVPSCERTDSSAVTRCRSSRPPLPERPPATLARPPRPGPRAWPSAWWTLHHIRGDASQFGAQPRNRVPRAGGVGVQRRRTAIRAATSGHCGLSQSPAEQLSARRHAPRQTEMDLVLRRRSTRVPTRRREARRGGLGCPVAVRGEGGLAKAAGHAEWLLGSLRVWDVVGVEGLVDDLACAVRDA
jgi:hypothetical protein